MSDLFWLTEAQISRLEPYFPKSHGKPRVDEPLPGRVLRGNVPRGTKIHAICDSKGRPINFFVSAGQVRWSGCRPP